MGRNFARILVVFVFAGIGWVAGHAQVQTAAQTAPANPADDRALDVGSNFELLVTTTNGETQIKCVRGCKLQWRPITRAANGEIYILDPGTAVGGVVSDKGCLAPSWGQKNCRILGWTKP